MLIWLDEQHLPWSEEEAAVLRDDAEAAWLLKKFPAGVHGRPDGSTLLVLFNHHGEPVETQDLHQSDKLAGHLALAVALTPWSAGRCDRVSVATEVRRDDGVGPGELRRNLTPAVVRLWKAVEEQHRRPRAAQHQVVAHIADANPPMLQERGSHPDNRGTVNDD